MEIEKPAEKKKYIEKHHRKYTKIANFYDNLTQRAPAYRQWLKKALEYILGNRVLEVGFGTGYLMSHYAGKYEAYGLDNNERMHDITANRLKNLGISAELDLGDVEQMPYSDSFFDTLICTFSFSNFPDGPAALKEMLRVVKPGGRIIILDMNHPKKFHIIGNLLISLYKLEGIIFRNMTELFDSFRLSRYKDIEISGFGTVHLYIIDK